MTYPYGEPVSMKEFVNRIDTEITERKVLATFSKEHYPHAPEFVSSPSTDFLLDRLHDYSTALKMAEDQIIDMQKPEPFLPEDFGFTPTIIDEKTYYSNKFGSMARMEDDKWMLQLGPALIPVTLPDRFTAHVVLVAIGLVQHENLINTQVHKLEAKDLNEDEKATVIRLCQKQLDEIEAMLTGNDMLSEEQKEILNGRKEKMLAEIEEINKK